MRRINDIKIPLIFRYDAVIDVTKVNIMSDNGNTNI